MSQTATATRARILLVDEDRIVLDSLGGLLAGEGYDVTPAASIPQATDHLQAGRYNLVLAEVSMPHGDGFELLRYVRAQHPDTVVILMTGYGTIESAVDAIKQGAYEYLTKPIIDDDLRMAVERALRQQQLIEENRRLRRALRDGADEREVLGRDPRMLRVFELADAVAPRDTTVLITGESGTGKSLIARAIHRRSGRAGGPFVEVACGALPEGLLESELFGHVRGAFTGAVADRDGKFTAAAGGTIFLDEVATASPQLQVRLLRVLQDGRFEPVGSTQTRQADARVILATNHDLAAQVAAGRFREDLYYRINVVTIELPPLRDRRGDVALLAEHFLQRHRTRMTTPAERFAADVLDLLARHDWPGNVRELENAIERAVVLARGPEITAADLPPQVRSGAAGGQADAPGEPTTLAEAVAQAERRAIRSALAAHGGARQRAAAQLGIDRTTLFKKMRRHGIEG